MSDYTPIACELYARYELWILRGQTLRVIWRGANASLHIETLRPIDLQTRAHVEYLVAKRGTGEHLELRVDRIAGAEPL